MPTAEELFEKLQKWVKAATVEELIKAMHDVARETFDSPRLKRQLIRSLFLPLSLKVLRDDYVDKG